MSKFLTPMLLLLLVAPAFAVDMHRNDAAGTGDTSQTADKIGTMMLKNEIAGYKRVHELTDFSLASSGFEDFPMSSDIFENSYRSPGKSFLYSIAVPGAGQLYTKSRTKAVIFMGVEALAWTGYYMYHHSGRTKESDFRAYADKYWDPELYYDWLVETHGITDDHNPSQLTGDTFTHHLPDTKTQQYYEEIGKYDQFEYGWIDTDYRRGDSTSAYRDKYLHSRADANSQFDKAKIGAIVSIANHLVSAFDAALSARKYNREQDTFSEYKLTPGMVAYEGKSIPQLMFTYTF